MSAANRAFDYAPALVREGWTIVHRGTALDVYLIQFRLGRGLSFHTRHTDGMLGPVIYPHPDESVTVRSTNGNAEPLDYGGHIGDYPFATVVH